MILAELIILWDWDTGFILAILLFMLKKQCFMLHKFTPPKKTTILYVVEK